jgi:hypothetical protein
VWVGGEVVGKNLDASPVYQAPNMGEDKHSELACLEQEGAHKGCGSYHKNNQEL